MASGLPAGGAAVHGPFLILQAPSIGPGPSQPASFSGDEDGSMHQLILLETVRPAVHCMHGPRKDAWRADACMAARARGDDTAHAPLPRPSTPSASCRHGPWCSSNRHACMHSYSLEIIVNIVPQTSEARSVAFY